MSSRRVAGYEKTPSILVHGQGIAAWSGGKTPRPRLDPPRAAAARRILIVDDDPDIRAALSELLESEGYEVTSAANGAAALAQLRGEGAKPCAILLDLMMPYMNGWEFRAEQLRDPELRDIPIVLLTASGYNDATVRAEFGRVEYFPKPPSPERLLATIRLLVAPH
jgi:CheY-like chemotaxis protein